MAKGKTSPEEYKKRLRALADAAKEKYPGWDPRWIESVYIQVADMTLMQLRWNMQGVRKSFIGEASQPVVGGMMHWAEAQGITQEAVINFIGKQVQVDLNPLIEEATGHVPAKMVIGEMGKGPTQEFNYDRDPRDLVRQIMEHILGHGEMPEKVFVVGPDGQVMEQPNIFHPGRKVKPEDLN